MGFRRVFTQKSHGARISGDLSAFEVSRSSFGYRLGFSGNVGLTRVGLTRFYFIDEVLQKAVEKTLNLTKIWLGKTQTSPATVTTSLENPWSA